MSLSPRSSTFRTTIVLSVDGKKSLKLNFISQNNCGALSKFGGLLMSRMPRYKHKFVAKGVAKAIRLKSY